MKRLLLALALALASSAYADSDSGSLSIAQTSKGVLEGAVETKAAGDIGRGWQTFRQQNRFRASIIAQWPLSVRGEARALTTELMYDLDAGGLGSWSYLMGSWSGYVALFSCPPKMNECLAVDLKAGTATFRDVIVNEHADKDIPGLRINGVWKFRLHLDRDGKVLHPSSPAE